MVVFVLAKNIRLECGEREEDDTQEHKLSGGSRKLFRKNRDHVNQVTRRDIITAVEKLRNGDADFLLQTFALHISRTIRFPFIGS